MVGTVGWGPVWRGVVRQGSAWLARRGQIGSGTVRWGLVWQGPARFGTVRQGEDFMSWQEQQRQAYEQQQAEKQAKQQQEAERYRLLLKAQFEERARQEAERTAELERQAEAKRQAALQQQAEMDRRVREALARSNQERYARQQEAREQISARKQQETRVFIGQDGYRYRSLAELEFYEEWVRDGVRVETIPLERQFSIGRYRADFADPASKTAIEVDSWGYHGKVQADFERGYERKFDIEELGWAIVQVTARQIYNDVEGTVARVHRRIIRRRAAIVGKDYT